MTKAKARKERVPLGVQRLKMAVSKRNGYQRRWVNDVGGRINQAIDGGYALVPRDDAKFEQSDAINRNESLNNAVCKTVNSDGTKSYLMEIPMAMYHSDQMAKVKQIEQTEDGLREGSDGHGKPGSDGRYIPTEGIKIS